MNCLADETLARLVGGGLAEAEIDAAHQHAETCPRCRELLAQLAVAQRVVDQDSTPAPDGDESEEPAIGEGETVDQYRILHLVGQGGMGRVFAAEDETLGRRVAVKVVRPGASGGDTEGWTARLVREAQAMAKLTHPNVLTIYSAGTKGDDVYVAMELVDGVTLREWVVDRPWRQVLQAYIAAGQGLAAAHAAGLVHRDFKPSNVLVSSDGRVLVTDFGLVARSGELDAGGIPDAEWAENLTLAGAIMGTPAYMAPEQFARTETDASADQFSFCVALWEAVFRQKPFVGDTSVRIAQAVIGGERRPTPRNRHVPVWLRKAIDRGLNVDPALRWQDMNALLEALTRGQARGRGIWIGAVSVVVAAAVVAGAWRRADAELCVDATEEQLAGVWDDARRADVEAAMLGTDVPFAARVAQNTARDLDTYTSEWTRMYLEACDAATEGEEQSADGVLRMSCLHQAKVDLGAAVGLLATADPGVVRKAHDILGRLRPLWRCTDSESLRSKVEPPGPDEVAAVEAARARLGQARARFNAGLYPEAREQLEAARVVLESVAYGPVQTELALAEGQTLDELGEYEEAVTALERALELAAQWDQRLLMGRAAAALLYVVGHRQQRPEEGLRYLGVARALAKGDAEAESNVRTKHATVLEALGKYAEAEVEHRQALELREQALGPEHPRTATTRSNLATALHEQGKYEDAAGELQRALDVQEKALGLKHPDVATTRNNLAVVLKAQGKYEDAEAEHRRALALRVDALGPEHPDVAESHNNLSLVLRELGRYDEAEVEQRKALPMLEKALGPEHPQVARSLNNLATVLNAKGELEESAALFERSLELREKALGPEHPVVASSRNNLAAVLYAQQKYDDAELQFRQALRIQEATLGPGHPAVARSRHNRATVLHALGKNVEAEAEFRLALAVRKESLGEDHPELATSYQSLARLLLAQGRADEALPFAEQGWKQRQRTDRPVVARANAAFLLARALSQSGGDRGRARKLAEQALQIYRSVNGAEQDAAEVETWLRDNG